MPTNSYPYLPEWTYVEDSMGIVYCIGRETANNKYEAIAVYLKSQNNTGYKTKLYGNNSYERLMYHGMPEEESILQKLPPHIKQNLINHLSTEDSCLYLDTTIDSLQLLPYMEISSWLDNAMPESKSFVSSLILTLKALKLADIPTDAVSLYGGAAFGLVNSTNKVVDDVDVLLNISSSKLYSFVKANQSRFSWIELNPLNTLSERRLMLKAKRWSTSQVRLSTPYNLSIDLKIAREANQSSLWDQLNNDGNWHYYSGILKVVDDTEVFCISPTLLCVDSAGETKILLMKGYPYIGCAIVGDTISVVGRTQKHSSVILVTQSINDHIKPDMSSVPVY